MLAKLKAVLELMRPREWSKTFGNMLIAATVALFLSGSAIFTLSNAVLFVLGFLAAGVLLWSGLYILNDWVDWREDAKHPVKKNRVIPSGRIKSREAFLLAAILILLAFAISFFINFYFYLCFLIMLANQVLYSFKPFRLKEKAVLDIVSGSAVSPAFRFLAGWTLFETAVFPPLSIFAFVVLIQVAGFPLYRLASRELEQSIGYKSSVVVFSEGKVKLASCFLGIIAGLSFIFAIFEFLGLKFFILVILSLIAVPLYFKALTQPTKMNLHKMHKLLYYHYFLFSVGFALLFLI